MTLPLPPELAQRDAADPLRAFRDEFIFPQHAGQDVAYLVGNSLGLQPKTARAQIDEVLDSWATRGVEGHFAGEAPWLRYHRLLREPLARLVGAKPDEVVAMNSLTANLHLMLVAFYQPTIARTAILVEAGSFPSDRYAVASQLSFHGLPTATTLIELEPDLPNGLYSTEHIEAAIREHGPRLATILWPGVQYRTGQAFDIARITQAGQAAGAIVGIDLAHSVGNLPLALHDWGVDFAVWCHYKYLNSGPGAVGGCFVHARHATTARPRFAGWWGQAADTRFRMGPDFLPTPGADGWQLSNPPVLAMAPLRAALHQFERAGMQALREKSLQLTGALERLIEAYLAEVIQILTPRDQEQRGAQLSLRVVGGREAGRSVFEWLGAHGVMCDWREPDVIRVAPAPLYCTHADVWRFVTTVMEWRDGR